MREPFYTYIIVGIFFLPVNITAQKSWKDTNRNFINAHGAGVLYYDGNYYLFGEIKKGKTWLVPGQNWECYRVPAGGVSCYSSKDLSTWRYEDVALAPVVGDSLNEIDTGKVIERPKVIYNNTTKKFVMWMHLEKKIIHLHMQELQSVTTPLVHTSILAAFNQMGKWQEI